MNQYSPPLDDFSFLLNQVFNINKHLQHCGLEQDADLAIAVAEEAGKLATDKLGPLNWSGDVEGATWTDGEVQTPQGFKAAYQEFCEGGWNGLRFPEQYGGQALSSTVSTMVDEIWHAANMSFALCPMLTNGAIEALLTAGSDQQKSLYLPKLVSGEWTGTMNITEPSAGSDLGAIQTKAIPAGDGTFRITGQKIFITYGEHDLAENIVHLVLARVAGGPTGVKGLSLFLVPKFLVNDDGTLGDRNDLKCVSIEHKLGIHGSPTAVMQFGEVDSAIGYLIGEENRGLEYMFIMMNDARFSVGIQGLSISSRAYLHALSYAKERVQGGAVGEPGAKGSTIIRHPDIRRLLLSMKSKIEAMRALAMYVAMQRDVCHSSKVESTERSAAQSRLEFLIPVLKGWFTEVAQDITYDAIQVFGGMGFIEETGVAQHYRDARIVTIYEGTTAIQANDLVGRKTLRDSAGEAYRLLEEIGQEISMLSSINHPACSIMTEQLEFALVEMKLVLNWMLGKSREAPREVYAGSVPYLQMWGLICGAWMHARRLNAILSNVEELDSTGSAVISSALFFAEQVLPQAVAMSCGIRNGGEFALNYPDSAW